MGASWKTIYYSSMYNISNKYKYVISLGINIYVSNKIIEDAIKKYYKHNYMNSMDSIFK